MITENLLGKIFTFEKYEDTTPLNWTDRKEKYIGNKFEVLMIHSVKPEFCYIRMIEDESIQMYYPTEIVLKQLSLNYLPDLYQIILKLTKEICKSKK